MSENVPTLVKKFRSFYEVSPYYIVVDERHGSPQGSTRKILAGFDVDVYGVNARRGVAPPGADPDYELGCAALEKIAENVSHRATDSCFVEVITFPSRIVIDQRNQGAVEGMVRLRITHRRGLDQPAGAAEENALQELETQLRTIGLGRR